MMIWRRSVMQIKEEISSIDTIGPVIAGSLTDYFFKRG